MQEERGEGTINETLEADRDYRKDKYEAYERGYAKGKTDAKPHWIPCSEGLPKDEGFYLVTLEHRYSAETNIRFFKIENGERYWSLWGNENITAWMPLPEPYKGVTT